MWKLEFGTRLFRERGKAGAELEKLLPLASTVIHRPATL